MDFTDSLVVISTSSLFIMMLADKCCQAARFAIWTSASAKSG